MVLCTLCTQILTDSVEVKTLDLATCSARDTDFTSEFVLHFSEAAAAAGTPCHAIVLWFDTHFSARFCAEHPVTLSTSPHEPPTHWAQTVLMFK